MPKDLDSLLHLGFDIYKRGGYIEVERYDVVRLLVCEPRRRIPACCNDLVAPCGELFHEGSTYARGGARDKPNVWFLHFVDFYVPGRLVFSVATG